ncbi:MAG: hypothetical protein HOP19_03690 [Acidobacteria bacterium]|nr:hypothetical protein [Acidobacteriota bacterium]
MTEAQFAKLILLTNVAATFYMVGVIWCIQIVHYPLFAQVGKDGFAAYEAAHSNLITPVVGLPMLVELATAGLLLFFRSPAIRLSEAIFGVILVGMIWCSTMFLQVPQHSILAAGFEVKAHQFLVNSNWLRTIAWSLRGALALWMTAKVMR